jgi:hypothetical protein
MSVYVEALLLLLPPDAGGRSSPVCPREGSYRPFVRSGDVVRRARVFEGPSRLVPGDEARVMIEVEELDALNAPAELEVLEHDERVVGLLTVLGVCRTASAV